MGEDLARYTNTQLYDMCIDDLAEGEISNAQRIYAFLKSRQNPHSDSARKNRLAGYLLDISRAIGRNRQPTVSAPSREMRTLVRKGQVSPYIVHGEVVFAASEPDGERHKIERIREGLLRGADKRLVICTYSYCQKGSGGLTELLQELLNSNPRLEIAIALDYRVKRSPNKYSKTGSPKPHIHDLEQFAARSGKRVTLIKARPLHTKAIIADGWKILLGSANFAPLTAHETVIYFEDAALGARLEQEILRLPVYQDDDGEKPSVCEIPSRRERSRSRTKSE